jgi:hypothetical protein
VKTSTSSPVKPTLAGSTTMRLPIVCATWPAL